MKLWSLLFLFPQCWRVSQADPQPFGSAAGTFQIAVDVLGDTWSWAAKSLHMMEQCPFVDDPIAALNAHLPATISGQDQGLTMILDVFSAWEFSRKAGLQQPLVLAITGPTGVGKSETGFATAQAILAAQSQIGTSRRTMPEGYLVLEGQDYSDTSEAFVGKNHGLPEVHRRINERITDHLRKCDGGGVIVFDEIQKVVPGALDILIGGLKERGEFRIHSGDSSRAGQGKVEVFPTNRVIFILTSDIGAQEMENLLLAYEDRTLIPQQLLRSEVKKALDKQWERLQFGSVVSEVIPYLPLEQLQVEQIMSLKLMTMSLDYRNLYWLDLVVDESVIQALSRTPYVPYRIRRQKLKQGDGSYVEREKTMATYGARGIDNGGPVQDLKTKMFKHMTPWKKGSVLYITSKGFDKTKNTMQFPEIVMYWCSVDISMTPLPAESHHSSPKQQQRQQASSTSGGGYDIRQFSTLRRVGNYRILEKHVKSPLCVERWRGQLHRDSSGGA
mmetsp:Transcript_25103/g.46925  ORF Transcript_25103/g.46925 Transcript_25103/m.46925 type:complete len:501 (-) Transcript_25103:106-1608(-)